MNWIIYKHTLLVDCDHKGWAYIGLTQQDLSDRWKSGLGYKNQVFYKAIKKYGWENFSHEILEESIETLEEANNREQYWISFYHTWLGDEFCQGYNATKGGDGTVGYTWGLESRKKLSLSKVGIKHTDEYNAKLSELTGQGKIICIETGIIYYSHGDAYRQTGIRHILECCHRHRTVAGGYHWAFLNDLEQQMKFSEFREQPRHINKLAKRKVRCIETNEEFESIIAANKKLNGNYDISRAIKTNSLAGGYHWDYVDL